MGPCRFCGRAGAFGFDPRLARIRAAAGPIWACAAHRAGLPSKKHGKQNMDILADFLDDEVEDLARAAARMARYWKDAGLDDAVKAIGREQGIEGARVLLGTYFELRAIRQNAEHQRVADALPY